MKNVTQVSEFLIEYGAATGTFTTKDLQESNKLPLTEGYQVSDETYGPKSMLYIKCLNVQDRFRLENFLESKGVRIFKEYYPGSSVIELQVSYFKGHHWEE